MIHFNERKMKRISATTDSLIGCTTDEESAKNLLSVHMVGDENKLQDGSDAGAGVFIEPDRFRTIWVLMGFNDNEDKL